MREEQLRRRPPEQPRRERPRPTFEVAELKAIALLAEAKLTRLPIDVEYCAQLAGIALIHREKLGGRSAYLSVVGGLPGIVVEKTHPMTRQRFSIAHEVGHWVLERAPITHELAPLANRGRAYDALERICDYFAASLLMPRIWVRDRAEAGLTPADLARDFDVSLDAMTSRLRELGLARPR